MKQMLAWLCAILTWASVTAWAAGDVPHAKDLQRDGAQAAAMRGVILLVLVGEHCVYCERVLNEFLIPMSRQPAYQNKVVMRRLMVSDPRAMLDFNGRRTTPAALAGQYGYRLVPTVLVLDAKGRMLAKPLVGLLTEDYYGMYLDEAIDLGVAKVRGLPLPATTL
jgi:thioredoxin-related protein